MRIRRRASIVAETATLCAENDHKCLNHTDVI